MWQNIDAEIAHGNDIRGSGGSASSSSTAVDDIEESWVIGSYDNATSKSSANLSATLAQNFSAPTK